MFDRRFTIPAYAKVNLNLRVLGRRPDNFHEIQTIFQTITLHDLLTFESTEDGHIELTCSEPNIPTDERNLVQRAAKRLRERFHSTCGVRIHLEKRIPSEAGLGGGSSDAAVSLLALSQLWKIEAGKRKLEEIGSQLGADVPFFLTGGTALGTGLGTRIRPLKDAPQKYLVVIKPAAKVSTAEAYKALNMTALTKAKVPVILPVSYAEAHVSDSFYEKMNNDFEPVIFELYPEIKRAKMALIEAGAQKALLAGSGSSVFGIFSSDKEAEHAQESLQAETDWRIHTCRTLSRDEYKRSFGNAGAFSVSSLL